MLTKPHESPPPISEQHPTALNVHIEVNIEVNKGHKQLHRLHCVGHCLPIQRRPRCPATIKPTDWWRKRARDVEATGVDLTEPIRFYAITSTGERVWSKPIRLQVSMAERKPRYRDIEP